MIGCGEGGKERQTLSVMYCVKTAKGGRESPSPPSVDQLVVESYLRIDLRRVLWWFSHDKIDLFCHGFSIPGERDAVTSPHLTLEMCKTGQLNDPVHSDRVFQKTRSYDLFIIIRSFFQQWQAQGGVHTVHSKVTIINQFINYLYSFLMISHITIISNVVYYLYP